MSLSSASKLGSISMRLTSCLQVIVTFTKPAPASAVTSTKASSSWAFFRFSCMACACFMRPASCPLLNMGVSFKFGRENGLIRLHADGNVDGESDDHIDLVVMGLMLPGTILAPQSRIMSCTNGSA